MFYVTPGQITSSRRVASFYKLPLAESSVRSLEHALRVWLVSRAQYGRVTHTAFSPSSRNLCANAFNPLFVYMHIQ